MSDTSPQRNSGSIYNLSRILSTPSSSSRMSVASSRYTTSGLTANSTIYSMDDLQSIATSNSSAIDFLDESMESDLEIIDNLGFEDVGIDVIDNENIYRNREAIITNLVQSEETYLKSLELILSMFYLPLKKDPDNSSTSFSFLGKRKTICTEREMKWLFGNVEELVNVHRLTCKSLKERLRIWGPAQILSDVFQAWFPNLQCYKAYLCHYDVSLTTYERLTRYQPFKKFLENAQSQKALKGSTLLSLLQLPVSCADRYLNMITQLVSSTPQMHPDYASLQKCKVWIEQFHKSVHHKLIEAENVNQVLKLHQAIVCAPFTIQTARRLVLEGQLSRIMSNTMREKRHCVLFSDMLVFLKPKTEGKLHYKGHLVLERARVRPLLKEEASGFAYCIEIVSSFSGVDNLNTTFIGAPTVYVLCMGSEEARNEWLSKLEYVIKKLEKIAVTKYAQNTRRMIQSRTPKGSIYSSNDESSSVTS